MKRTPFKRYRKTTYAKLKRLADLALSWYVRKQEKWTCFTCGYRSTDPKNMHAGHFIPRSKMGTRYDLQNVHAQCKQCNVFLHGNLHIYAQKLIEKYGPGVIKKLNTKAMPTVISRGALQAIIDLYNFTT